MQSSPQTVLPDGLVALDAEPGEFWCGAWMNVNIAVWRASASRAAVERLDRTVPERVQALSQRLSTVHIATPRAGVPGADARAAFAEAAKRWAHTTGCVSVVIEHAGFAASALRSAVTGVQLVSGAVFPMRAHKSIDEAVPWFVEAHAQTTGVKLPAEELSRVLQSARACCS
jgi:hypothetical protein